MADGPKTLFIACGALAREFLAVSKASGWDDRVEITCLPAIWHNRPEKIAPGVQRKIRAGRKKFDRIIAIGSDGMMNAVARARHEVLKPYLKSSHCAIGSINSPMQCMMKEVCAQCLQPHKDPVTGVETVVFSCFNQDQPLDQVDFGALRQRLGQNSVHEKLTVQWIDHALKQLDEKRATA